LIVFGLKLRSEGEDLLHGAPDVDGDDDVSVRDSSGEVPDVVENDSSGLEVVGVVEE